MWRLSQVAGCCSLGLAPTSQKTLKNTAGFAAGRCWWITTVAWFLRRHGFTAACLSHMWALATCKFPRGGGVAGGGGAMWHILYIPSYCSNHIWTSWHLGFPKEYVCRPEKLHPEPRCWVLGGSRGRVGLLLKNIYYTQSSSYGGGAWRRRWWDGWNIRGIAQPSRDCSSATISMPNNESNWTLLVTGDLAFLWHLMKKDCCCLVAKSCLSLYDPMNCSTPGLPVPHYLPEI